MNHKKRLLLTTAALAACLAGCGSDSEPYREPPPEQPTAREATAPAAPSVPAAPTPAPPVAPTPPAPPAPVVKAPAPPVSPPVATPPVVAKEGSEVGLRIPAWKAQIRRPDASWDKPADFDAHATKKPTVYIVNSTTCPYTTNYIDRMKTLEASYMAKGVDVVHVYPVREQTAKDKLDHHRQQAFKGGFVDDADVRFVKGLQVTKTPTAILAAADGTILYRGRIDDNVAPAKVHVRELADAIDEHLAGKQVTVKTTEPFG